MQFVAILNKQAVNPLRVTPFSWQNSSNTSVLILTMSPYMWPPGSGACFGSKSRASVTASTCNSSPPDHLPYRTYSVTAARQTYSLEEAVFDSPADAIIAVEWDWEVHHLGCVGVSRGGSKDGVSRSGRVCIGCANGSRIQKEAFKAHHSWQWCHANLVACSHMLHGTITTALRRSLPASHLLASQPALEHTSEFHISVVQYTVQIIIQIALSIRQVNALPLLGKISLRRPFVPAPTVKFSLLAIASPVLFS